MSEKTADLVDHGIRLASERLIATVEGQVDQLWKGNTLIIARLIDMLAAGHEMSSPEQVMVEVEEWVTGLGLPDDD